MKTKMHPTSKVKILGKVQLLIGDVFIIIIIIIIIIISICLIIFALLFLSFLRKY